MHTTTLEATQRNQKPKKLRSAGFIPAVLNGPGTTSIPVMFQSGAVNKVIMKHGTKAKLWIDFQSEKKFGFMKEIQRDPVDHKIIHVSIQLVATDQEVKMQLPLQFHGIGELEEKALQLQICKAEAEITGKAVLMPECITVDLSEKEAGDNITAANFNLSDEITVLDPEDEIYAIIKEVKEVAEAAAPAEEPLEAAE